MSASRTESDSMGPMQVPADAYYGAQTARAVENFPISNLRFSRQFLRALGLIKKHAAATNAGLREAGWHGSSDVVRLGMSATIAAKYAWIAPAILRAAAEDRALLNRRPFVETMRWWGPAVGFLLDRGGLCVEYHARVPHSKDFCGGPHDPD